MSDEILVGHLNDFFSFLRHNTPTADADVPCSKQLQSILINVNTCMINTQIHDGTAPFVCPGVSENLPTPGDDSYRAFTTNTTLQVRGAAWKVCLFGPLLVQRYALGANPIAAARTDPYALDLCDSGDATEQEHLKFRLYPSSPSLTQYSYTTAAQYEQLCARGPSERHHLVRDDSFRTFRTADRDANQFLQAVPEAALVRVCDAFDHVYSSQGFQYCQGMNVYAGVFLYVLPELDAFNLFSLFCTQYIPLYWRSNHIGAEAGCRTLDSVLAQVDPILSQRLLHAKPCELTGLIIAFAPIKTMSAIAPPLAQVLLLWDFLMAAGPHLSVLCVAAQIHNIRDKVINAEFPKDMLDYRKWPQLDARRIIRQALSFMGKLDARLLKDVMLHPVSDHAVFQLAGRRTYNRTGEINK